MPNEFDTLPDEQDTPDPLPDPGDPDAPSEEDKKRKEEEIRKLTIANRIEEKRIADLKQKLSEKRREAKDLNKKIADPEADPDPQDPPQDPDPKPAEDVVKKTVAEILQKRDQEEASKRLIEKIRSSAKTKQEAEAIFEEAKKFPDDWSVEDKVTFAQQRVQVLRERSRGFVIPSATTPTGFDDLDTRSQDEEIPGISKSRVETLKQNGWTVDEIKKFKDGPDLGRVWGDGKVLVNRRSLT